MKEKDNKNITIIGLGYTGLTLAIAFAEIGFNVYGVDIDQKKIKSFLSGKADFLDKISYSHYCNHLGQSLKIFTKIGEWTSNLYIVTVGTPIDINNCPNLAQIKSSMRMIGTALKKNDMVILRSTVPVGTTRNLCLPILEKYSQLKAGSDFNLVFAPDRSLTGRAYEELFILPQLLGSLSADGIRIATNFFRKLTPKVVPLKSLEAAEIAKLINNSFRDLVFSFANEVSLICSYWGIDSFELIESSNKDYPRNPIPMPNPGVGGTCLSKDPLIFSFSAMKKGYSTKLVGKTRAVTIDMVKYICNKLESFCSLIGCTMSNFVIFVIGFAFKGYPETKDMRDSVTLELVSFLIEKGAKVKGYDPVVKTTDLKINKGIMPCDLIEGFRNANAVVIMNNHRSYLKWELEELFKNTFKPLLFFDCLHLFDHNDLLSFKGICYSTLCSDYGWPKHKEKKNHE